MSWVVIGQRTPLSASLPAKTWTLALLHATSAVGLAAIAAAPLSGGAPTRLYAACGVLLVLAITAGLLMSGLASAIAGCSRSPPYVSSWLPSRCRSPAAAAPLSSQAPA